MTECTIKSYTITTKPIPGICKQPALWGNGIQKKGNDESSSMSTPLIYFQKPKWISQKSFLEIVNAVRLDWPRTFIITSEEKDDPPQR